MLLNVDYLSAGNKEFQEDVMENLRNTYMFGKICRKSFTFTGINVQLNEEMKIYLDQNEYVKNMDTFYYEKQVNDNILDKEENRMVRKTTGQLCWAASRTQPDLAYNARQLSTVVNRATFKDAKE